MVIKEVNDLRRWHYSFFSGTFADDAQGFFNGSKTIKRKERLLESFSWFLLKLCQVNEQWIHHEAKFLEILLSYYEPLRNYEHLKHFSFFFSAFSSSNQNEFDLIWFSGITHFNYLLLVKSNNHILSALSSQNGVTHSLNFEKYGWAFSLGHKTTTWHVETVFIQPFLTVNML